MTLLSAINWEMDPNLISWKFITIRWYGVLFALAFVFGFYFMTWVFKREKRPIDDLDRLLMFMVGGTIIGARLGHCLFYEPHKYFNDPSQYIDVIKVWQGGLASHGAALGLYIGIYLYSRGRKNQGYLWCLDRISIPVVLSGCLIRLGNLCNSEIIGHKTSVAWGFIFKRAWQIKDPIDRLVPRHPAQLYEAICYLIVFLVIATLYMYKDAGKRTGLLHGLFLIGIFTARIGVEFFKLRQAPIMKDLPISMGQVLSVPFILLGIWLIIRSFKQPEPATSKEKQT